MKKFLRMLNDFLNAREYEMRVRDQQERLLSELRYAQDLLIEQSSSDVSSEARAKIDVYVFYLKEQRRKKRERMSGFMKGR